jgi:hypothetical protein
MPNAEATPPTQELPLPQGRESYEGPAPQGRRFHALAAAVRAHRVVTSHSSVAMRPSDHALYRRLSEIEASPPIPGEDGEAPRAAA